MTWREIKVSVIPPARLPVFVPWRGECTRCAHIRINGETHRCARHRGPGSAACSAMRFDGACGPGAVLFEEAPQAGITERDG